MLMQDDLFQRVYIDFRSVFVFSFVRKVANLNTEKIKQHRRSLAVYYE